MITDTIVGAVLIVAIFGFTFLATVCTVVVAVWVWSLGWTALPWIVGGIAFLLAAHRLGDGAHVVHPRSSFQGPKHP